MRVVVFLAFARSGWTVSGCSPATPAQGNFGRPPHLHIRPSANAAASRVLRLQFTAAHARADSIVRLAIPDTSDYRSLSTGYSFSYPNWVAHATDTLPGPALAYEFVYSLLYKGDTIGSAVVSISPTLRINPSELAELRAYHQFLAGELVIGPKQAVASATRYGITQQGASVGFYAEGFTSRPTLHQVQAYYKTFTFSPSNCYWLVENECNGCVRVKVNAATGEVFDRGIITFMY